ncbi:MAG: adenine deaminase [Methanomicrobiales archaeon]|nr:adenine deaminase [Methanomicrobiales archaeon]
MERLLASALGEEPADTVFTGGTLFNPLDCSWEETSFAVAGGIVVGTGEYRGREVHDLRGARVVPGLIDAHVHLESSLLVPSEFARAVLGHGTTTVIADPHEIANVAGVPGIEYMLAEASRTPLDILLMLPSCVPSVPEDPGGATLSAADLRGFLGREGVLGLGEMMNVPGVLAGDAGVKEKLALSRIRDGHAPGLAGKPLNAYILAGLQSDHECTTLAEAREKLGKGMFIMIREGSTERNLSDLLPLVTPCTAGRCSLATDDRHADLLAAAGHIDDCIRRAVALGLDPDLALRMATLSPCERFGLQDRGAIAPGRVADFCVLGEGREFRVRETWKRGVPARGIPYRRPAVLRTPFRATLPDAASLRIEASGEARVIGLVPGQIATRELRYEVRGRELPDTGRDILKIVACDRYGRGGVGVGLVHGLGLASGAIASSVSHDAHNILAAGASDGEIARAIREVASRDGGMAAVSGERATVLPLECAGLMSAEPFEKVAGRLGELDREVASLGGIPRSFMQLSFLALPVIPELRITPRGLFDATSFRRVDLFPGGEKN